MKSYVFSKYETKCFLFIYVILYKSSGYISSDEDIAKIAGTVEAYQADVLEDEKGTFISSDLSMLYDDSVGTGRYQSRISGSCSRHHGFRMVVDFNLG